MAQNEAQQRSREELREDLYKRLDAEIGNLAKEKGVTREEMLQYAKDFLSGK